MHACGALETCVVGAVGWGGRGNDNLTYPLLVHACCALETRFVGAVGGGGRGMISGATLLSRACVLCVGNPRCRGGGIGGKGG